MGKVMSWEEKTLNFERLFQKREKFNNFRSTELIHIFENLMDIQSIMFIDIENEDHDLIKSFNDTFFVVCVNKQDKQDKIRLWEKVCNTEFLTYSGENINTLIEIYK